MEKEFKIEYDVVLQNDKIAHCETISSEFSFFFEDYKFKLNRLYEGDIIEYNLSKEAIKNNNVKDIKNIRITEI